MPLYVEQPMNLAIGNPRKIVIKLKKSVYGLAESPRLWNQKLDTELRNIEFKRLESDPCHCTRYITVLDHMSTISSSGKRMSHWFSGLRPRSGMNELGKAQWALGLAIWQRNDCIILDQRKYLDDVLARFNEFVDAKHHNPTTPLPAGLVLTRAQDSEDEAEQASVHRLPYRELIGCLLYLAVGTRPNIAFAMSALSRFVSNHNRAHWDAALHVLRYLRGTTTHGLRYAKKTRAAQGYTDSDLEDVRKTLIGFVDAEFATDPDTSRSVSGSVFTLGGTAVTWRLKQQSIVTTSTCHAEYVTACETAQETVWLGEFLSKIGVICSKPTVLFEDNEAARFLYENPATTDRSKRIRLRWHYLRQCVRDRTLKLCRVESKANATDALTKSIGGSALEMFHSSVGLIPYDTEG